MGRTEPASTGSKEVGLPVVPRKFIGIVMIGTTFTLTGAATEYNKLFKKERWFTTLFQSLHVVFLPARTIDC